MGVANTWAAVVPSMTVLQDSIKKIRLSNGIRRAFGGCQSRTAKMRRDNAKEG